MLHVGSCFLFGAIFLRDFRRVWRRQKGNPGERRCKLVEGGGGLGFLSNAYRPPISCTLGEHKVFIHRSSMPKTVSDNPSDGVSRAGGRASDLDVPTGNHYRKGEDVNTGLEEKARE